MNTLTDVKEKVMLELEKEWGELYLEILEIEWNLTIEEFIEQYYGPSLK